MKGKLSRNLDSPLTGRYLAIFAQPWVDPRHRPSRCTEEQRAIKMYLGFLVSLKNKSKVSVTLIPQRLLDGFKATNKTYFGPRKF